MTTATSSPSRHSLGDRLCTTTSCLVWFVGAGFAIERIGIFAHETNVAFAATLLVLGAVIAGIGREKVHGRATTVGRLIALVGFFALPFAMEVRALPLAIWFGGLAMVESARAHDSRRRTPATLALGIGLFALVQLAVVYGALPWYGLRSMSEAISRGVGALSDRPLALRPSFSGLEIYLLALAIVVAGMRLGGRREIRRGIVAIFSVTVLYGFYLRLFATLPFTFAEIEADGSWRHRLSGPYAFFFPLRMGLVLAPLLAGPLAWQLARGTTRDPVVIARRRFPVMVGVGAAAIVAVVCLVPRPSSEAPERVTVALYEKGFLNWGKPNPLIYGRGSTGMLGMLPEFLQTRGRETRMIDTIDDDSLDGADVLVIINQDELFTPETLAAIRRFNESGGGLLVIGDHTCHRHGKNVLNEPLEAVDADIRFAFDNAEFLIGGWIASLESRVHPISAAIRDRTNDCGSVIGASLDVTYPATPTRRRTLRILRSGPRRSSRSRFHGQSQTRSRRDARRHGSRRGARNR